MYFINTPNNISCVIGSHWISDNFGRIAGASIILSVASLAFMGFEIDAVAYQSDQPKVGQTCSKPIVIIPADEEKTIRELSLKYLAPYFGTLGEILNLTNSEKSTPLKPHASIQQGINFLFLLSILVPGNVPNSQG